MIELQARPGPFFRVRRRKFLRGGRIGESTAVLALIIGGGNGEPRARHTGSVRPGTDEPRRIGSPRGRQPHDHFRHSSAPDRRRCAGRNRARPVQAKRWQAGSTALVFAERTSDLRGAAHAGRSAIVPRRPSMARSSARTELRCRKGTGRSRPSSEPIKKSMRSALAAATRKPLGVGRCGRRRWSTPTEARSSR